jgi:predicted transcriptional regulator
MKQVAITLLCLLPITSFAQNPMGMSEADMQKMMQQMQEAQACMEKIDQSELHALEKKAKQFEAEMKSLCASGKRDAAQEKAMLYAKEIANNPVIQQTRKCSEKMQGAMQGMSQNMPYMGQDKDYSSQHVCDSGI